MTRRRHRGASGLLWHSVFHLCHECPLCDFILSLQCPQVYAHAIYTYYLNNNISNKVYRTTNNQHNNSFLKFPLISLYFSFFFFLFLHKDLPLLPHNTHPRLLHIRCWGAYFLSLSIRLVSLEVTFLSAVLFCNAPSRLRIILDQGFVSKGLPMRYKPKVSIALLHI